MPKKPEEQKPRKNSRKQEAILAALRDLSSSDGAPTDHTPSAVGVKCGKDAGSPASDWAYPGIKTLVRKGLVEKGATPGRYRLPQTGGAETTEKES